MKIGRPDSKFNTGRRYVGPVRVSYVQKNGSKSVLLIRFTPQVVKDARWKTGDGVDIDVDDSGAVTVARAKKGWSLSGKNVKAGLTVRLTLFPEDTKALKRFEIPADVLEYAEDGGDVVFQLPMANGHID